MEENTTLENGNVGLPQTAEELQMLLQKEGDRRVSEALKKADRKKDEAVKEAQRLAQMSEQEKFKYEIEQRESALKEREEKLTLAENKIEASKILAAKGLPISLVDFVVATNAETMATRIKDLESAFTEAVKVEVENRLKSNRPIVGAQKQKVDYSKMCLEDIQAIFRNGGLT